MRENKVKVFFLIFLFPFLGLPASPLNGWETGKGFATLFMEGRRVFDSKERPRSLPEFPENKKIEFALLVSEYYLRQGDKEGVAGIIYLLRSGNKNYRLADYLLSSLWKLRKNDVPGAEKKMNEYISSENDPYLASLAKIFLENLKPGSSSSENLKNIFKELSCNKSLPYYPVCRVFKLKWQLDKLTEENKNLHRDYLNLDRVIAPFFEEQDLAYIYSMNSLVPDLPVKLLVLGFAEEAAHFQNMLINSEKLSGTLDPVSYERLSFYQTISGDLASGEETLNSLLRHLSQKELFKRNEIYLRLGAIAFLRRDYKGALKYSLNLNFKNWGPMIRNPFTGEPVSVNTAKDLAAVYVWKSKSSIKAVKALGVIKKGEAVTEPELFVRLRMAHILFPDKPDVAEKITEEIIYTAQSRGWKQAEYSATLLQGYIHIINKNYRKAVIQFTKAYGILGENFPDYSSEWVRNAGLVAAHRASGEPAPLDKQIHYLATRFRDRAQYDDLFCLKNYLDLRFDTESFMKNATEYYIENRNYSSLVELLFSYHKSYFIASRANKKGILQIADADKRLKLFGSMKPEADGKYFSGELNKNREEESERNRKVNDEFDSSVFENLKDPVLICLPWKKQFFLFFYNPAGDAKWKFAKLESSDFKSSSFQKLINEYAGTVRKENTIQIFLNPPGMEIYQYLRSKSGPQNFVFFYNFSRKKNIPVSGNLVPVAVPRKGEPVKSSVAYYDASYFEGSKLFHEKARLHIWNFYGTKKDSESGNLEGYIWEAGKDGEIHFNRLRRRMDYRTSPEAILFTSDSLKKSFWENMSSDFIPFVEFWLRKGSSVVFYLPKIDPEKESHAMLVSKLSSQYLASDIMLTLGAEFRKNDIDLIIVKRSPQ